MHPPANHPLDDFPLNTGDVLELINDHERIFIHQSSQHSRVVTKDLPEVKNEIVEIHDLLMLLERFKSLEDTLR
jgi:bifunctional DNA-binding transcriptional regulator/antitoxin component of YhaV-PrlF toxin-antitoxin module